MKSLFLATTAIVALSTGAQAANIVITTAAPTAVTVAGTAFIAQNSVSDQGGGGFTTVNGVRPDTLVAADTGSLEIRGDRSRYNIGNLFGNAASPGFSFQSLNSLTFDWNVDVNGSIQPHGSPAVRAVVADTDGRRVELVWEYVYNGGTAGVNAPTD